MAKIVRKTQLIFGLNALLTQISQFGSLAAGAPAYSTDPAVIQNLSNWLSGWFAGVEGSNSPAIEDMNAFCYVVAYQLAYLFQAGIAEYDSGTTYYTNSLCTSGGVLYTSLTDTNLANTPASSPTQWAPAGLSGVMTALGDTVYGGTGGAATKLAGNITTTKNFLVQTGSGAASAAPVWQQFIAPTKQFFNTPGTFTNGYTTPAGCLYIVVHVVGAGGGGGGSFNTSANTSVGAGGGGGAYCKTIITSPSAAYTFTIGTGGSGGTGASGSAGGASGFAGITCGGGAAGSALAAGTALAYAVGGIGGTVSGAATTDIKVAGGTGTTAMIYSATISAAGTGGSSFFAGSQQNPNTVSGSINGNNGAGAGAGGSGAMGVGTSSAASGGSGLNGAVLVEEFYQ